MSWTLSIGPWSTGPEIEVTDATATSMRARLHEPSELTITIPGDSPQTTHFNEFVTDAWLLADGQPVFRGRLVASSDSVGVDYQASFTFKDYRYVLDRRVLYQDAFRVYYPQAPAVPPAGPFYNILAGYSTPVPQESLFKQLIDYAQAKVGGNLGITYNSGSVPVTGIVLGGSGGGSFQPGDKVAASINTLANLVVGTDPGVPTGAGFDWDIDANMVAWLYYPWRGVDNGITLDYGGIVTYTANRSVSDTDYANAIFQSGGAAQAPLELTATDLAWRAEGRWDSSFPLEPVLSTVAGVLAKAKYNLGVSSQFQPTYTFQLIQNAWSKSMLWLGDTVTYAINRGRLQNVSSTTRVYEIGIEFDASFYATVSVTTGAPKITLIDNLDHMGNVLWYLRTR